MSTRRPRFPRLNASLLCPVLAVASLAAGCTDPKPPAGLLTPDGPNALLDPDANCVFAFQEVTTGGKILSANADYVGRFPASAVGHQGADKASLTWTLVKAEATCAESSRLAERNIALTTSAGRRVAPYLRVGATGDAFDPSATAPPPGKASATVYLAFVLHGDESPRSVSLFRHREPGIDLAPLSGPATGDTIKIPVERGYRDKPF